MHDCSLQHWILLSPPDTSTTEWHFCIGPGSPFFLKLFLHSSSVAYQTLTSLWGSSSGGISFCLFILFMGFLSQEYITGLSFPSPVSHVLSELSTMSRPSWVALHDMAHSFLELHKAVIHVIIWGSFLWLCFVLFCFLEAGDSCFLMGGTGCGVNWVLLLWAELCSVNI